MGEKPTFGTDPRDPWSARAGITEEAINETALLNRYLKSRGINPEFVSKDQKVAHSKTNQFKVWMQAHVNDSIREGMSSEHTPTEKKLHALKRAMHYQKEIRVAGATKQLHSEAADKKDVVSLDIPLLIRVLELAREDLKSDMDLHRVVETLISIRNKGVLTMDDYNTIANIKEEYEEIIESYHGARGDKLLAVSYKAYAAGDVEKSNRAHKLAMKAGEKYRSNPANREKVISHAMGGAAADYGKKPGQYTGDSVEHPADTNVIAETMVEPMAATQSPYDGANSPDDTIPAKRKQMSKSARIIKAVYKKSGIKEEMYDHEKEDKSVASPGKKTKLQKLGIDVTTRQSPPAAAVLSGGKTLTGEPRDTIEIDPMMKMRKPSPNSQKSV